MILNITTTFLRIIITISLYYYIMFSSYFPNGSGYFDEPGILTREQIAEISKTISDSVAKDIQKEVSEKLRDFQKLEVK